VILWHAGLTMLVMWFVMRGNPRVDYRIVAAASLLPDLIDKPIGRIIFKSRFESGRIFAHTLLVNLALFCVLFFMRGRIKRQFVLVPISSLLHLAEDGVWSTPQVFWWPLFGTGFPKDPVPGGLLAFLNPANDPSVIWQEGIGLACILWLLASHGLLNGDGVRSFIRTGRLEQPREMAT
jgi:hypothetical protein